MMDYEYDPCEDCKANGDDWYVDEDGEMRCACDECYVADIWEDEE